MIEVTIALAIHGEAEHEKDAYDMVNRFHKELDTLLVERFDKFNPQGNHLAVAEAHVDYLPPGSHTKE